MHTLNNNDIRGLHSHGTIHKPAVWRAEPPTHGDHPFRPVEAIGAFRDQIARSHPEPQTAALRGDDFPFSALIRLVRQLRE